MGQQILVGLAQAASSEGRFYTSSLEKLTPTATYATCDPKHTIVEFEPLSLGWSLSEQQMEKRAGSQWEILESWNSLELIFYNLIFKAVSMGQGRSKTRCILLHSICKERITTSYLL